MKKCIVFLILMLLLNLACAVAEENAAYTWGDYTYCLQEDGTAQITDIETSLRHSSAPLFIPRAIDGYTVTSLGTSSFFCCYATEITIPDSVIHIGDSAFSDCKELRTITIPDSVVQVDGNIFAGSTKLKAIQVADTHPTLKAEDGVLFDKEMTRLISYPCDLQELEYTVPESVRHIGSDAFYCSTHLKSVRMSEGVLTIGKDAFASSDKLCAVQIPSTVTEIGAGAFRYCECLEEITLPEGLAVIEKETFYGCGKLGRITIPQSVTGIGDYAFDQCHSLTEVVIPAGVTSMGSNPFAHCNQLTSLQVEWENPVFSIVNNALVEKVNKRLICIPKIPAIIRYEVPNGICSIDPYAFLNCQLLTEIILPDSLVSIEERAFEDCWVLGCITIPDSVVSIGDLAFTRCFLLTEVIIPDGVTKIGEKAFMYCRNLSFAVIPASVTQMGNDVFDGCSDTLQILTEEDSYAAQWCEDHYGYRYIYIPKN